MIKKSLSPLDALIKSAEEFDNNGNVNDIVKLNANNDIINASAGNDVVFTRGGDNVVLGGSGNEGLVGGEGNVRCATAMAMISSTASKARTAWKAAWAMTS